MSNDYFYAIIFVVVREIVVENSWSFFVVVIYDIYKNIVLEMRSILSSQTGQQLHLQYIGIKHRRY